MALDLGSRQVHDSMITSVPIITPKTTIATALRLLREHRVPALPVYAGGDLLGLVDEPALLRYTPSEVTTLDVYELREVLDRLTVGRATSPRTPVRPDAGLDEVAALMVRTESNALPVVDQGRFLGLLTWSSLLRAAVGEPVPA